MFISKRKFDEAIRKAQSEVEEKLWKIHDEEWKRRYEGERMEKFDERLRRVEEACGLVKTEKVCPCGVTIHPNVKI
jgi:hypothetical protein